MCIIAVKAAGRPLPNAEIMQTMWNNNPHGAGFMYAKGGAVNIRKGFMDFADFQAALGRIENATALPIVLHFRISTGGGVCPAMCHPFPLSNNDAALRAPWTQAAVGIAHNGILDYPATKTTSDTYEYIKGQLFPLSQALPKWYKNPHAMQLVKNATDGSRLAILTASGEIITTGEGWYEDGGILYSNGSYIGSRYAFTLEDEWNDDAWEKDTRRLMQLDYGVHLIKTESGEWIEADGFAIDNERRVYEYNYYEDAWELLPPPYEARSFEGLPIQFDDECAALEFVL